MSVLVKICGITTSEDASLCARAGADRLGVIFAESPRQVTLQQARTIAAAAPRTPLTGVFVGCDPEAVGEAVETVGLSHVQVHGCPDRADWERIAWACARPVIPALTMAQISDTAEFDDRFTLLLDLDKDPALRTAQHVAELHEKAAELVRRGIPILLAGGLDPQTATRVAHRTGCVGVDVASGVESTPGVKDPRLVQQFIQAARGMEYGHVH